MKITLILLAGLLSGCASFISGISEGHPNRKEIYVPPGATAVTLAVGAQEDSDHDGSIKIPRGAGPFRSNVGRVEKDGYVIGVVRGRVNWWIAGNFVYGGAPGAIVDFADGAAYNPQIVYLVEPTKVAR